MEAISTIHSDGLRLHGILYQPAAPRAPALVICDPFAEEKKCAHRPLVDLARALCHAGYPVLRFDYRGCGDSEGEFAAADLHAWARDIHAAADWLKEAAGLLPIGLAGLRLGAALADEVARARHDISHLLLWEPVMDGRRYVAHNLRRSLIKAMLTQGAPSPAQGRPQQQAGPVDFDGYAVSEAAMSQLEAVQLGTARPPFGAHALVLNIGPRQEPQEPYVQLARSYPRGIALGLRLEPFWNRIGLMDVGPLIAITLQWLEQTPLRDP